MWPETIEGPLDRIARVVEAARAAHFSEAVTLENAHWGEDLDARFPWECGAIYLIEDLGDPAETAEAFTLYRQNLTPQNRHRLKILQPTGSGSQVLHVGACSRNLRGALRQHVMSVTAATPALKLSWWFTPRPYRIHLRRYDVEPPVLDLIRSAMVEELRPAFA